MKHYFVEQNYAADTKKWHEGSFLCSPLTEATHLSTKDYNYNARHRTFLHAKHQKNTQTYFWDQ